MYFFQVFFFIIALKFFYLLLKETEAALQRY